MSMAIFYKFNSVKKTERGSIVKKYLNSIEIDWC